MPTICCTLGLDAADAVLNRPAVVLRPAETAALEVFAAARPMPLTRAALGAEGMRRVFGMSELPALREELRAGLVAIEAAALPGQLVLALALQRLVTVCGTALEFGMNLYVRLADEGE